MRLGLGPRQIGFEVLKAELQLLVTEPLGPPAELAALELLHDQPRPLDVSLRFGEGGALDDKRAHYACSVSTSSGRAARAILALI